MLTSRGKADRPPIRPPLRVCPPLADINPCISGCLTHPATKEGLPGILSVAGDSHPCVQKILICCLLERGARGSLCCWPGSPVGIWSCSGAAFLPRCPDSPKDVGAVCICVCVHGPMHGWEPQVPASGPHPPYPPHLCALCCCAELQSLCLAVILGGQDSHIPLELGPDTCLPSGHSSAQVPSTRL